MPLDPELRELLLAAVNMDIAHVGVDERPMLSFHPYSARASYGPSRLWFTNAGKNAHDNHDARDTYEAVDRFNRAVAVVMARLPRDEHDQLVAEAMHLDVKYIQNGDTFNADYLPAAE